jgi:hypothetical protein
MKSNSIQFRLAAGILLAAWTPAFGQRTGTLKMKTTTSRAGVFADDKYVGHAGNFGVTRS